MNSRSKYFLLLLLLPLVGVFTSCEEDDAVNGGEPIIHYVRVTKPASSDSLLVAGYLGNLVAIMGDNLGNAKELWFDDKEAILNPNFVTNKSILVSIPNAAPDEVLNRILIKFGNGKELAHEFKIQISAPVVGAMKNEYASIGTETTISGDFFFEPIKVTFSGNVEAEVQSTTQNMLTIIVPEGAESGPVTVTTNFGSTASTFHYKDQRNIFLNYDDKNADGSWRPGLYVNDEHSIDANYLKLSGNYSAASPREEGPVGDDYYTSQFWGHTRLPAGSLIPGDPENHVLKFEAKVNEWYASYLNICFGPWDNGGNQEVWSNGFNPRAIWGPWAEADATFSTNGEWITVTIPITDFMWNMGTNDEGNVVYTASEAMFNKDNAGSLSFWVLAAPQADNSRFEVYIDNVRIVEK